MRVLFFWKSSSVPIMPYRQLCIERVVEVYPDAELIAITDNEKIFPEQFQIISLDDFILEIFDIFHKDEYEFVSNLIVFSDFARLYYLSKYPNTLYLDTDTYCRRPLPKLKSGQIGARLKPMNNDVLFNNDNTAAFEEMLERRNEFHKEIYQQMNLQPLVKIFFEKDSIDLHSYFGHKIDYEMEPKVQAMLKDGNYGRY